MIVWSNLKVRKIGKVTAGSYLMGLRGKNFSLDCTKQTVFRKFGVLLEIYIYNILPFQLRSMF